MPSFDVAAFLGITPMVGKEALPNEVARLAENCRLEGGDLESWKAPSTVLALTSLSPVLSIYRYGILGTDETQFWFQWTTDVDVIKGPVAEDTEERTYWTGDGAYPKKTKADIATTAPPYPSNHFRLGIPIPAAAPIVAITGTPTDPDNDPTETSVWGYTYVSTWDEEGPMSPLSLVASWQPGETPGLSGMSAAPAGPYSINRKRIYRSANGTNASAMQLVAEIAVATATYSDTIATSLLGKLAETRLWTPPPDDLAGLCMMANEIAAGFSKNTVRLSEPGVPYAWPERNTYTFTSPVVGIKPFGNSLLVCCKRGNYILTGADPTQMSDEDISQAGVLLSKRAMVAMMDGVVFPSSMGLEYVGPGGYRRLTAISFDERQWAAFAPASWIAACVNGRYVVSYNNGVTQGGLVFSFVTPQAIVTTTVFGTAMWTEEATDKLYLVQSNVVKRWDGGSLLTARWASKAFRYPKPVNMGYARVEADTYPVTFRFYANDVLIHTETVADGYAFPLPDGDETLEISFQYEGASRVSRIQGATTIDELKQLG